MAILETQHLSKHYRRGGPAAVEDVNLRSSEGEFLVFLGPSGAGKSTLLRMIAGLEQPSAGEILIGGRVVTDLAPRERRIAMVFQSYALYPHLTVAQNIAFPLKAQKVPRDQHWRKVEWASSLLGIGQLLDRRPRELSGGERQRVALARAIVREPSLFLLDEPLSNLDAKLRATAREELARFHKETATTTVYVTHDQVEAMAMGDRIVVLHEGFVRQIGTPREVYDEPADTFVATFLGSPPMNVLDVDGVRAGIRPEHLVPAAQAPQARLRFPLRVTNLEYLGSERIVYARLEDGRFAGQPLVARISASIPGTFGEGTVHPFAVDERLVKLFDRATGKRIPPRPLSWS
jgi:multiple sugar transport system ATP-binding protein